MRPHDQLPVPALFTIFPMNDIPNYHCLPDSELKSRVLDDGPPLEKLDVTLTKSELKMDVKSPPSEFNDAARENVLDTIHAQSKSARENFNNTIPVSLKISQAHLDLLKKFIIPVPKNETEKQYVKSLTYMTKSELNTFLVEVAVKTMISNECAKLVGK